ncbi:nuclear transport factor 2 family protein [Agromyces sp. MMS17-SY077]|uniref:Nuclear transport factor 2 family protein n=2 Tax=Agromyces seonyuensis TaxID=2662446 RepID=A0A6I4P4V7_9MICO|nr:nuclear transport factor 2 family protein [Agromyces seonyuensis]
MRTNLLEVFGERDAGRRREAIERTYTDDVVFVDPEGETVGRAALDAKVRGLLDGAPGLVFRPDGEPRVVRELGYLAWTLGPDGGEPVARGVDLGFVRDGRLEKVYTVLFD